MIYVDFFFSVWHPFLLFSYIFFFVSISLIVSGMGFSPFLLPFFVFLFFFLGVLGLAGYYLETLRRF